MRRMISGFIAMLLLTASVLSCEVMAIETPDLGELASEAASGFSDVVSDMSGAVSGISETAGQAGELLSDMSKDAGLAVSGTMDQVGDVTSGFASKAHEVLAKWGKEAGETADDVKEQLSEAGVTVKESAKELGDATARKASELTKQAGEGVDDAIDAVSGTAGYVVDQAGHVVDLAAIGAEYVSDGAQDVLQALQEYGASLMKIAEDAAAEIDLSKPENWQMAQTAVYAAIDKAYAEGIIDHGAISEETMRTASRIVFAALIYGNQYQNEQITLGEYVSCMSEILIREGLPAGVAFLVRLLPINIPYAETMAKEIAYYLISLAYEDKPGDEIESEEETILKETAGTETEKDAGIGTETEKDTGTETERDA